MFTNLIIWVLAIGLVILTCAEAQLRRRVRSERQRLQEQLAQLVVRQSYATSAEELATLSQELGALAEQDLSDRAFLQRVINQYGLVVQQALNVSRQRNPRTYTCQHCGADVRIRELRDHLESHGLAVHKGEWVDVCNKFIEE